MGKDIFNGKKSMYSGMSDQRGVAYHSNQGDEGSVANHSYLLGGVILRIPFKSGGCQTKERGVANHSNHLFVYS